MSQSLQHIAKLRGYRAAAPRAVDLRESLNLACSQIKAARKTSGRVGTLIPLIPPRLVGFAELLPVEDKVLRILPQHAAARAAWSTWLRSGGEHELIRASGGTIRQIRLVTNVRSKSAARARTNATRGRAR